MTVILDTRPVKWSGSRDNEGHRTYKVTFQLSTDDYLDGPATVLESMPPVGSQWNFGNDFDTWAWALPDAQVTPKTNGETCKQWWGEQTYSTKPPDVNRCATQTITNPLLIPPEVSGDFVKYTEEISYDRFGLPVVNSAWEQFRGPKVEFDKNRSTVKIKIRYAQKNELIDAMVDTLNDSDIWGYPYRCVKLSKAPWSRKFYGSCYVYYEYDLEFDVNIRNGVSGFDRDLLDIGKKVLNGSWLEGGAGSGLTVDIASVSGSSTTPPNQITAVSLGSGGSGYQANQDALVISLSGGGGTGGQVQAVTNASGVVTSITLFRPGTGYSVGIAATRGAVGWQLIPINGQPPDPTNPGHFIQFKDRNGENTEVVLNGFGQPCNQVTAIPPTPPNPVQIYVSVQDNNTGHTLTSASAFWVLLPDGMLSTVWSPTADYEIGQLVTTSTGTGPPVNGTVVNATNTNPIVIQTSPGNQGLTTGQSVTIAGVTGNTAANGTWSITVVDADHFSIPEAGNAPYISGGTWSAPGLEGFLWLCIATSFANPPATSPTEWQAMPAALTFRGVWTLTTTYAVGDVAQSTPAVPPLPGTTGPAGNIHVEYYEESDFTLLGIPLEL